MTKKFGHPNFRVTDKVRWRLFLGRIKRWPGMKSRVSATFLKKFFPESLFTGADIKYLSAFTWSSVWFVSSDRSSYSVDGLLYIYLYIQQRFSDFENLCLFSVTLCHFNSINNWSHKSHKRMLNVHWTFGPLVHWSIGPWDPWSIGPWVHWSIGSLVK